LLLSLLVGAAAAWPLLAEPGLLNTRGGGDSPFLLQRLHQLTAALMDGHFPARWMPDANYGYGYPFYNYYAPLSIYIAALFKLIGFSFVRAIHLAQLAGFLVAAWGMFELGRRWLGSPQAGLLASAAYTLAPFHMVNVYVRGDSLAEFWAMAFYPLALLAADNVGRAFLPGHTADKNAQLTSGIALALTFAALILSHNISALIFTPFLLLYLGLGLLTNLRSLKEFGGLQARYFLAVSAALALGAALAAWFWLPALGEQKLAQLGPVTEGYFHYSAHFREIGVNGGAGFLAQASLLFNYDVTHGDPFRMGLVQAGLALAGGLFLLWRVRENWRPYLFIAIALIVSTLMITPWSRPLWDNLPYLPFTQFPWRFLSVQALAAALAIGGLAALSRRVWLTVGLVILLLFSGLGDLQPDHLYLADEDVTAVKLAEYEWFTGNIGSTVSAEYLPQTVQPRPYSSGWLVHGNRNRAQFLRGDGTATLQNRRTARQSWTVDITEGGAALMLPTMDWPGWEAEANGRPVPITPTPGSGLITVELPAGTHDLTLTLRRTPRRLAGELISLAALLLTAVALGPRLVKSRRLIPAAVALSLLLLAARWSTPPPFPPGSQSWDFAQMGYLHHAPDGILFSDGRRLLRYEYDRDELAAGESLAVTMLWENGQGPLRVELVSPAVNRFAQAPIIAAAEGQIEEEAILLRLHLPPQTPPGLYVLRLDLPEAAALTGSGQRRGELFLRPLRVTSAPSPEPAIANLNVTAGPAVIRAAPLAAPAAGCWPGEPGGVVLELPLNWFTPAPLSHNYNVSLRLADERGHTLAQCDSQPGYGFLPATSWPPGAWTADWLALPLPHLPTDAEGLALTAQLYAPGAERPILLRRLGEMTYLAGEWRFTAHEPHFDPPEETAELTAIFADNIALRGYALAQTDAEIGLTLVWQALAADLPDWTRFVHLLPVEGGEPMAQYDSQPRHNSHPTSQWVRGEIVADGLWLDITAAPPGDYRLAVGLYHAINGERATAVDGDGRFLPDNIFLLPELFQIKSGQ
jgi:hypothetical protein